LKRDVESGVGSIIEINGSIPSRSGSIKKEDGSIPVKSGSIKREKVQSRREVVQ
jgi:hypothetical protein